MIKAVLEWVEEKKDLTILAMLGQCVYLVENKITFNWLHIMTYVCLLLFLLVMVWAFVQMGGGGW